MRSERAQKNLEQTLVQAIIAAGFNQIEISKRSTSAKYSFFDPRTSKTYTSHTNGYVRCSYIAQGYFSHGQKHLTPITREMVHNPIERLVYILRRAQSPLVSAAGSAYKF